MYIYQLNDSREIFSPTITPAGGFFDRDQIAIVKSVTPAVMIHYTTDGRDPTEIDPWLPSGGTIQIGSNLISQRAA